MLSFDGGESYILHAAHRLRGSSMPQGWCTGRIVSAAGFTRRLV
jgi:hypothetical protein